MAPPRTILPHVVVNQAYDRQRRSWFRIARDLVGVGSDRAFDDEGQRPFDDRNRRPFDDGRRRRGGRDTRRWRLRAIDDDRLRIDGRATLGTGSRCNQTKLLLGSKERVDVEFFRRSHQEVIRAARARTFPVTTRRGRVALAVLVARVTHIPLDRTSTSPAGTQRSGAK